eukprot:3940542-Rhodomonas_salina.2
MEQFKDDFLQCFNGTNEGAVHEYLGCEVVRDWEKGSLSLLQRWYTECVLKIYGFDKATSVCTPLSPGIHLTKQDCPAVLDSALHRLQWYCRAPLVSSPVHVPGFELSLHGAV